MNDTFTWTELGTTPVAVGDSITVCGAMLYAETVRHVDPFGWGGFWFTTTAENEGRSWIRGHHTAVSEQGQALLAAHALLK